MELLNQETKAIMEDCKRRAKEAGLQIQGETLEYLVTNRNLLELMPKMMIPTLYDYWVQNVEVIRNKWMYEVYPHNPYETVINTKPPLSFYNRDNADWLNVTIFYHVLGHIDHFQNNIYYRKTWNDDFCGQALADKRLIAKIRQEKGAEKRWVDYIIEFALGIDNLVGYYPELEEIDIEEKPEIFGRVSPKIDFYFGEFLKKRREEKIIELKFYYDEIERYNRCLQQFGQKAEIAFFEDNYFRSKFPEFNDIFKKWQEEKNKKPRPKDILQYLMENSEFLNKEDNKWMKEVIQVIRRTSLHFQPMIRTRICSEGWASLWHERLYLADERIKGHEIGYALLDSDVAVDPRVGLNSYAIGRHLFEFIEDMARKGKFSREYQLVRNIEARKHYDQNWGEDFAKQILFEARRYLDDYQLINFLSDDDFQDFLQKYKIFLAGIRPHRDPLKRSAGLLEVYIKSKSAQDVRRQLNKMLYHPPRIVIDEEKAKESQLYLNHIYEGRQLVREYIPPVLIGLEFLWGKPVNLETTEYIEEKKEATYGWVMPFTGAPQTFTETEPEFKKVRVLYTCKDRKVGRKVLS